MDAAGDGQNNRGRKMSIAPSKPKHIEDEIRRYNPRLFTKWNGQTDRWELWHKGKTAVVRIKVIESDERAYRPVDRRILWWIHENDLWRKYKNPRDAYNQITELENQENNYRRKQFQNQITDVTNATFHWMNRGRDGGKGDNPRPVNKAAYYQNYDAVFRRG